MFGYLGVLLLGCFLGMVFVCSCDLGLLALGFRLAYVFTVGLPCCGFMIFVSGVGLDCHAVCKTSRLYCF